MDPTGDENWVADDEQRQSVTSRPENEIEIISTRIEDHGTNDPLEDILQRRINETIQSRREDGWDLDGVESGPVTVDLPGVNERYVMVLSFRKVV